MPKDGAGALGLLLPLLACLISHGGAQEVPDLKCHTDFEAEVFCHWEATNTTNCAWEFQVNVRNDDGQRLECKDLENRRSPESASSSCGCFILGKISYMAKYTLLLVTRMNQSKEYIVVLRENVKPRPLRNLAVTKSKRQSWILAWEKSYGPSFILNKPEAFYQIQISAEGQKQLQEKFNHLVLNVALRPFAWDRNDADKDLRNLTEQTEQYEIFTDRLLTGKNYTARIRYKVVGWGTFWSEWSSPCGWFNDLGKEPGHQLWMFVLLVCFLVLVLVSTCYCCLARLKQQWWDQIPSPKIADGLGKTPGLIPWQMLTGDEGKASFCATSQDLLERSFMDSLPKEDGSTFTDRLDEAKDVSGSMLKGKREAVLTPEVPSVEPALTVCSPVVDPDPGTQAEEEEDRVPDNDALVGLFLEILVGGHSKEGAEPPKPVWEASPPARTPEPVLGGTCLFGRSPRKSPRGVPSESGYQNSEVAASSSRAVSPAPEQHQVDSQAFSSLQYKLLLFPPPLPSPPYRLVVTDRLGSLADGGQGGSRAMTPPPSCYKSFSTLVGQPTANFLQSRGNQGDQARFLGSWPPCHEEELLSPPQHLGPSCNAPDAPGAVDSCLPGYQPFRAASQDPSSLCLSSP